MENQEKKEYIQEQDNKNVRNNIFLQNEQFLQKNPNFQNIPQQEQTTNPLENEEEHKHLKMILSAFFNYKVKEFSLYRLTLSEMLLAWNEISIQ